MEAARNGNMAPLRKHYPKLAEFLHPPPLGAGQYKRQLSQLEKPARDLVSRIRSLWSANFNRKRRRRDDGITAVEIAARYLGEKPGTVAYWVKNKPPSK
jgi:hypothetical protein